MDEAAHRATRLKRSGRQKGAWIYLDAELLKRAGIDPSAEIEATRYALTDARRTKAGKQRTGGRIILNLRLVGQQ